MKEKILATTTEEIVIHYANFSGRETDNRAEFRLRTRDIISQALDEYREWSINDCLPKKADNSARKFCDKEFIAGYNACIDQILSNKDKK